MKVALFSNYLNHHQLAFCQAMDRLTDHQFLFVAFTPTPGFRRKLGYQEMNDSYPFVLKAYESREKYVEALAVALKYDVMIIGSAPETFVKQRMTRNLLTLRYSERLYRDTVLRAFSPRGMVHRYRDHTRYRRQNIYLLCASAYTAFDFMLSGAYIGKTYKWGYFPRMLMYDPDVLQRKKQPRSILWAGRLIGLKHPEQALDAAERLKRDGVSFEMSIIGSGEMEAGQRQAIADRGLGGLVHMKGNMAPDEVRMHMEQAEVFLFTSDFQEGWGAVLNEAMNSGCAVIASHAIGSVPFMIRDGENGLIYRNGDTDQLYSHIRRLLENPEERERLGRAAYRTIIGQWNADTAAERVLALAADLKQDGKCDRYADGPCSRAKIIGNKWYRKQKSR